MKAFKIGRDLHYKINEVFSSKFKSTGSAQN